MPVVSLKEKLASFSEHWSPRIVAGFNGHDIMVVQAKGEFVWHSHPDTDDFFLVLEGRLTIELRDGNVHLGPGDLYVVPRGRAPACRRGRGSPAADRAAGTPNTGDKTTAAVKVAT